MIDALEVTEIACCLLPVAVGLTGVILAGLVSAPRVNTDPAPAVAVSSVARGVHDVSRVTALTRLSPGPCHNAAGQLRSGLSYVLSRPGPEAALPGAPGATRMREIKNVVIMIIARLSPSLAGVRCPVLSSGMRGIRRGPNKYRHAHKN